MNLRRLTNQLTEYCIAHAKKNHGENGKKVSGGSIPLRDEDFELIPYIMTAPDYVRKGVTDMGRDSIRFYKRLSNGYVVVAEKEYKNSPDDMDTITMWAEMSSSEATNARHKAIPDNYVRNAILEEDAAKIRNDAETAIRNDKEIRGQRVFHGSGADFDAKITDRVRFFRTSEGEAYGYTTGGKIYIDPRIATSETPIHEYTHLWSTALRHNDPAAWSSIVSTMKGTSLWDKVRETYPELKTDDAIADEVLARYSGRQGASRLTAEMDKLRSDRHASPLAKAAAMQAINNVRNALKRFWHHVASLLHLPANRTTSAEDIADSVLSDLLGRVDPRTEMDIEAVNTDSRTQFHRVTDKATLDRLNSEPTQKAYRAMQVIDGRLYPLDDALKRQHVLAQNVSVECLPSVVTSRQCRARQP